MQVRSNCQSTMKFGACQVDLLFQEDQDSIQPEVLTLSSKTKVTIIKLYISGLLQMMKRDKLLRKYSSMRGYMENSISV